MKSILAIILVTANLQLFATSLEALPPFAQSKKEIQAILESPDIQKYIPSGDMIINIAKTDFGYLIVTNNRSVGVIIHYQPQGKMGPAQFEVEFMTPTELPVESEALEEIQ